MRHSPTDTLPHPRPRRPQIEGLVLDTHHNETLPYGGSHPHFLDHSFLFFKMVEWTRTYYINVNRKWRMVLVGALPLYTGCVGVAVSVAGIYTQLRIHHRYWNLVVVLVRLSFSFFFFFSAEVVQRQSLLSQTPRPQLVVVA